MSESCFKDSLKQFLSSAVFQNLTSRVLLGVFVLISPFSDVKKW